MCTTYINKRLFYTLCHLQVVRDAPWEYTEEFLEKHKIDFVAHDDIPYTTYDCEDTYAWIKALDMFVATERTEGIITIQFVTAHIHLHHQFLS